MSKKINCKTKYVQQMCCCSAGYSEDYWLFFKIGEFVLLKFRKLMNISILIDF